MSRRLKAILIGTSAVVALFAVLGGLGVRAASGDGAYRQLGVYGEVLQRIRSEYVEEPNMTQVTDGALHGLVESLDANSSYLNPSEYRLYKQHRADGKGNIGATLSKRFGYAAVISVIPGGPAAKAGVEGGDIIEAIDGRSTREMSLAEIQNLMPGQVGSNITFSIVRARRNEPQKITVTRDLVRVPPVSERVLEGDVGYLKVETLGKGRAQEIASKIRALENAGAKSLVLDLRGVAEGELSEGVAVANLFLDRGVIAYLEGQKYARETFTADPAKAITSLPLVVLVDRGTAGAAEVVAAAVLENARGDVVGGRTFGLGSVQKIIEIGDGSALILSVAKYYSPGGKAIQDNAVTPNVVVASAQDQFDLEGEGEAEGPEEPAKPGAREDDVLKRALDLVKGRKS
ncbi:MAG TPA: S41 family peptidase [Terriglobales bacterium]|nr:S41 family peptidase [Terriglobales bacterium]